MQENTQFSKMNFRQFIQRLTADGTEGDDDEGQHKAYLSVFNIFAAFPQLRQDVDFSVINRYKLKHTVAGWIGPAETLTGYHIDWGDNILAQISGRKEVHLVSPDQTPFMYASQKFDQGTTISAVDTEHQDAENYPLFEKVIPWKVTLEPGQMLFIPRGWWHHVRSLDKSISVSNITFDLRGILFDAIPSRIKQVLHDAGVWPCECTCHVIQDGKRVRK